MKKSRARQSEPYPAIPHYPATTISSDRSTHHPVRLGLAVAMARLEAPHLWRGRSHRSAWHRSAGLRPAER